MLITKTLTQSEIKVGDIVTYAPMFFPEYDESRIQKNTAEGRKRREQLIAIAARKQSRARLTVVGKEYVGIVVEDGKERFMTFAHFLAAKKI